MPDVSGVALGAAREKGRPPRDNLVRAMRGGVVLRAAKPSAGDPEPSNNANGMPTLYGHFTPFNRWTEIDSWFEGNFMERIAPGAFKKTFRETTPKVLFQHGGDPQIGDKVLGPPEVLREDDEGPYYEVPLLDTAYNRELVPGLEAGLYGASFRFSVMREEFVEEPGLSDHNPKGLPERTLKELRVPEFGPVSFPAYPDATAGVRSMTDEFLIARATGSPDSLRAILNYLDEREARMRPASAEKGSDGPEGPSDDVSAALREVQAVLQRQIEDSEAVLAVTVSEASTILAGLAAGQITQDPAPPKDRAEAEPHPVAGRREASPNGLYGGELLYGIDLTEETKNPWKL